MSVAAARQGERQGDFLGGKYLLGDCLGIGGMGEVYRATNVSLGRNVAIKLLNKEHTSNEDDVLRFLREARAAAAVRHPNVVDVFDVARDDDGTPFIVQELLSGEDLEQHLLGTPDGRLGIDEALEIMIPVADAVAAAHARDVVHRDLKPANIFLAREGDRIIPKVLDFGACLYKTVGALSAKERRMLIGTPHYMAPEQVSTATDVDTRADVWAMGVILYELLAGQTPFEAEDVNTVLRHVRSREIPKLRGLVPHASAKLEALVARCLDRDRKNRFRNAAAMRDEMAKLRAEKSNAARTRTETLPELEAAKPSSRVPSLALAAAPGAAPAKRRGSSLLTLSGPEDDSVWDNDPGGRPPPASASRPIEAAKPVFDGAREQNPPRVGGKRDPRAEDDAPDHAPALLAPPPAGPAPASARVEPPSKPTQPGAPRNIEFDDAGSGVDALDLDLEPPSMKRSGEDELAAASKPMRERHSSIPPVLDPRAAASPRRSDRPPPREAAPASARGSAPDGREGSVALSPPPLGAPPAMRGPRTPALPLPTSSPKRLWSSGAKVSFAAAVLAPALAAFAALSYASSVVAPIGHAIRGDSPLASGVLAVVTLVGAAALAPRALSAERSRALVVATVAAVVFGVVMIIVTFSASETAELGFPPAAAGIVPFVAPLLPIALGVAAASRAASIWLSPYERRDAVLYAALASLCVLAALELSPIGAVRAASAPNAALRGP